MMSFHSKCWVKGICFRCMYACMPWFSSDVGLLPFSQWQTQSDKSFWNATAFTMDTSTLLVRQEDVTGGMEPHFDEIQMFEKRKEDVILQRRCLWRWTRVKRNTRTERNNPLKRKNDVTVLSMLILFSEFVGRDRPRQLALNGSTTEYQLKNVAHDTEYVLTLYVLFGSVVGPGISATFKTCEYWYSICLPQPGVFIFFLCIHHKSILPSKNIMIHWEFVVFHTFFVWLTSHMPILTTMPVIVT